MRKMTIVLEVLVDDDELGEQAPVKDFQIRYLLSDALAEFRHPRRDPKQYVAKRYPESESYKWLDREEKAREVAARIALAEKLRHAVLAAEPKFEECLDLSEVDFAKPELC